MRWSGTAWRRCSSPRSARTSSGCGRRGRSTASSRSGGHSGRPGDPSFQRRVLEAALDVARATRGTGARGLPRADRGRVGGRRSRARCRHVTTRTCRRRSTRPAACAPPTSGSWPLGPHERRPSRRRRRRARGGRGDRPHRRRHAARGRPTCPGHHAHSASTSAPTTRRQRSRSPTTSPAHARPRHGSSARPRPAPCCKRAQAALRESGAPEADLALPRALDTTAAASGLTRTVGASSRRAPGDRLGSGRCLSSTSMRTSCSRR